MTIRSTLAAASVAVACGTAAAAPVVTFADDPGAGSTANLVDSKAARDAWLATLAGLTVGFQGFESFAANAAFPAAGAIAFLGSTITATVSSGRVLDAPFNARYAVGGAHYLDSSNTVRFNFSAPVTAFGTFVIDADENDNNPATVTQNGQLLTPQQIAARPFGSIDGILRVVTERSPGVFEVLNLGNTFPARDGSGYFVGVTDTVTPFTNLIFVNGTNALDVAFQDGFGYDDLYVATAVAPIPEPETWALFGAGAALLGAVARRRARRDAVAAVAA